MGILDLHTDELQTAGRNTAFIPPPAPTPRFSMWGTTTAAPRGVAAGAAESTGFWADVLGAFGQVAGAYPEALGVGGLTAQQRKEAGEARQKLLTEGVSFSSEAGDLFRGVAQDYKPDAQTASTAERLVFDFSRFGSKAVGYSLAAGGPVLGAALTGADEGMTAADELRGQGVDLATRTKVGALTGATAAAGVALPVAGKTLAQTAGLVALGGPLSFSGQQLATREILAGAGYDRIADQYDPLDPVGLAVSTLVPLGFGAWAMRGAARRGVAAREREATVREVDEGSAPLPDETVDAARVQLLAEEQQRASLAPEGDMRAADADAAAQARAADQIAAGEPVNVLREAGDLPPDARLTEMARAIDTVMRTEAEAVAAREAAVPVVEPLVRAEPEAAPAAEPDASPVAQVVRQALDQIRTEIETFTGQPLPRAEAQPQAEAKPTPTQLRMQELEARSPDMMVRIDGMDEPMPMREFMRQVKEQAQRETEDAQLVDVAAQCFLSTGG